MATQAQAVEVPAKSEVYGTAWIWEMASHHITW